MLEFRHRDEWTSRNENNFCIEVIRWSFISTPEENNWNVYAYLYPKHPLFKVLRKEADQSSCYSDFLDEVPFHCGCTLRQLIVTNGEECIKIGSDYQHYGDERFRQYRTKEEAREVFSDAENLARYLDTYGKTEPDSSE